jgi:MFS transporter, DHA1 family, tetracycline resistance protein
VCTSLVVVSTFIMGFLKRVDDLNLFIYLSFLAQILGGIGAGGNSTVTLATLSQFDNHDREKYIGWLEGAFGLGFILGPLLGAILYNFGGY